MTHWWRAAFRGAMAALAIALSMPARAAGEAIEIGAANLVAILRESLGENRPTEALEPYGKILAQLEDGREFEVEPSWFHYLGDMHIRMVFDGPQKMQSATPEDLRRLRLDTEQALALAAGNLRRMYGAPEVRVWQGGLLQVTGRASDLSSSYFLDREFWLDQQRHHPGGLVAAVPQRGGLVFAPADDVVAVERLRFGAVALYAGSRQARVSSALYLFKDGRWTVFQPPLRR
ncbi:MAG: hypothetical protein V4609_03605 [Pseudomonadota bacterium]